MNHATGQRRRAISARRRDSCCRVRGMFVTVRVCLPDAHRLRALLGPALPSALGDIVVYGFADTGHRYGVRGPTSEATLGFGMRLTLGAALP